MKNLKADSENNFSLLRFFYSMLIALILCLAYNPFTFLPAASEDCGECPNPLVEMKNLKTGDINSIADLFEQLTNEYYGWKEEEGISVSEELARGFNFLEFKKENPCANMYYTEMRQTGEKEEEIRHGPKGGRAKYYIQSTLNMTKAQLGEMTQGIHQTFDVKGNVISEKEDYLPKMGTVHIHHELICLKNNETYDAGDLRIDWLPEPPANEAYFGRGKDADGYIVGLFSKGSIAGMPIKLSRGDVGKTIRNKETPSSFSLDVEEEPLYPPYYQLKIHTIRNLLRESLPHNIFVAIRVKYGKIEGGQEIQGWKVFPTDGGEIKRPILYRVPDCPQTKQDILEMAAYCDWHAGEALVGKPQASQKIHIPECFNLTLFLSNTDYNLHEEETDFSQPNSYSLRSKETSEQCFEVSAFITFKKEPKFISHLSKDLIQYVYEVESWEIGSQNIFYRGQKDEVESSAYGIIHELHSWSRHNTSIQRLKLLGDGELIFTYDRKNEKIVELKEIPAFEAYVKSVEDYHSMSFTPERGWTSDDKIYHEEKYLGFIGESIKTQSISGDGKTSLIGEARKEKITPPGPCIPQVDVLWQKCWGRDLEVMRWELRKR